MKNKSNKSLLFNVLLLISGVTLLVGFLFLILGRSGETFFERKKTASKSSRGEISEKGKTNANLPHNSPNPNISQSNSVSASNSYSVKDVRNDQPKPNVIYLNAGPIDTDLPGTKARRQPLAYFSGKRLQLIQWRGAVQPSWITELNQLGVEIVDYIPENAYLVYGDWKVLSAMQKRMADKDYVRWEGVYRATDKIQPGALEASREEPDLFAVQMVLNPQSNPETLKTIRSLQISGAIKEEPAGKYYNVITHLPPEEIAKLAERPDIISIGPYATPKMFCERQAIIMAGQLNGNVPVLGSGYLTWLAGKGFTQAQFDASGLVVDVTDSPIDNGTTSPNHFALYRGGDIANASRMVYSRLEGTANSGSSTQAVDGHGNLNAHIIGGDVTLGTSPHVDAFGFHYGLGIAPFVRIGGSIIFDTSSFTNPNFPNLAARAYRDGVRISSNSWGADTAGAYDVNAQSYDALVRDAQPTGSAVAVSGNQQMTFVFAAGNAGSGTKTVGSPGTAKNVITVGAAENVQPFGGSDGSGISDAGADSVNDVISFSSRGPCADNRAKPDIMAPGTHVSGGAPQATKTMIGTGTALPAFSALALTNLGVSGGVNSRYFPSAGQQFYTASSGTSHSTPGVAGGAALVYQWFLNRGYAGPSPAMLKGFMMNSARYMTGVSANDNLYSNNQGMGMVNLETSFDGVSRLLKDQLAADIFTASGQTRSYVGTISSSTKPVRVTVAWTDAPGSTTGNAYKNNLDLTVVANGTTYKGNVFTGANSTAGGTADARNNVESVFLPAGISGNVTIAVAATNINSDGVPNYGTTVDQDFALVAYNLTEANPPPIVVMTAPTEGATVLPNAAVTLTAAATDLTLTGSAGVVSKVEFFDGTTSLGSVNSAPYSISWTPIASGVHALTAKATDSENAVGTSSIVNLRVLAGSGQPTLISFSPTSGVGGSLVTISGDNFAAGAGSSVRFNGVGAAFTVDSLNQITAIVPSSATTGVITVTTAYGTVTSLGNYTVVPIVLSEDLSTITSGNNTTTSGSSTPWVGNTLFPTVVNAYQAGGAVKLGTGSALGSITSKTLDLSGGAFDVSFDVKGWTGVEGQITVTATGQTAQKVTYTSVMSGSFETKVVHFSAGTAATTITLATTAKRAFLDNIIVTKASSSVTAPVISSSLAQSGTVGSAFNYQITASGSPTSFGATGLPAGLSVNASGTITGTPTSAGTSNVTISATNVTGTGSATLVITVNSSALAPVISISMAQLGTVGTAFNYQIAASSSPTSFGATGLPAGLSLNMSTGAISGTPTAAGTSNVAISATNGSGTGTATLVITISPSGGTNLLSEDFASLTTGGDTTTSSPSTTEITLNLTPNFPTSVAAFKAGGKVKLGTKDLAGSITSKALDLSANGGVFTVSFDVKGWTTVEGQIKVTVGSLAPQTVAYTATISSTSYETKTLSFTGGLANSTVKIETTANRAFIDNVIVATSSSSSTPTVSASGTLAAVNTTYGTASAVPTSFTVSGSNLNGAISITAPSGYEISQTAGGDAGYATTQTVGAAGTVAAKTIYVRLRATTPVGTYSGNVTCNSAGSAGATVASVASSVGKKQLTISGLVGVDKVYNGTIAAQLAGAPTYVGLVNGDYLGVTGVASASFADKNVGIGKTVTISGFTDPNGNYSVTAPTVTATITPKEVVTVELSGVNKPYDGTLVGALTGSGSLLGVEVGDQSRVVLSGTPLVSFVTENVGLEIELIVSGYVLSGLEAVNYSLVQPVGLAAAITPKPAVITANNQIKAFGTALTLGVGQREFSSTGLVEGELISTVTLVAAGGVGVQDAAGPYSISPSDPVGGVLNRFRSGNYAFTFVNGTLTVTAVGVPTFAEWAGAGVAMTPELLMKYAIGGAASASASGERPETKLVGTVLSLTAIVRKDSTLTIIGQAVTNLGDYGNSSSITPVSGSAVGVSQDGVPAGCERQKFTMDAGSARQAFLRISATK